MSAASKKIICFCNQISDETILAAIGDGANDLSQIYDRCGAGTGPCGGSCRSTILRMLHPPTAPPTNTAVNVGPRATDAPIELVEAISLFNRRYYWECHEVLEKIWLEERGQRRLFYQGLIQSAAALYHVLNANPQGVIRLAEEAEKKLSAYLPAYFEIPLTELIAALGVYRAQSREILGRMRSGFDYDLLPRLHLGPEMRSP